MERNSRKIIKLLKKDGFELLRIKGDHYIYAKQDRLVVLTHPRKDIPIGTLRNIYKSAGWL